MNGGTGQKKDQNPAQQVRIVKEPVGCFRGCFNVMVFLIVLYLFVRFFITG